MRRRGGIHTDAPRRRTEGWRQAEGSVPGAGKNTRPSMSPPKVTCIGKKQGTVCVLGEGAKGSRKDRVRSHLREEPRHRIPMSPDTHS